MSLHRCALGVAAVASLAIGTTVKADFVTEWVDVWLDTIRATGGPPCPIARNQAIVFVSVYEAVNSIGKTHEAYDDFLPVTYPAAPRAAVAAAAHKALVTLYPARAGIYDTLYAQQLAKIPYPKAKANGIALGEAAAQKILDLRSSDGAAVPDSYTYQNVPGAYRPTAPDFTSPPFNPGWTNTQCWAMDSSSQFRPRGPLGYKNLAPLLRSAGYAAQVNEVKEYGARKSAVRTPEQTEIAWFWANDRNGTYKPPGHLLHITQELARQQRLSLAENARLTALAAIAMADAGAVAWDMKYATDVDLWRPISAIRRADTDNNPRTTKAGGWWPLLEFSPPFPAYTSGHATFGAAHAAVMRNFFGTDHITFTVGTDEPIVSTVKRTFNTFSEAGRENGLSRIYLGVHFRFDVDIGYATGTVLGNFVSRNYLRPISCPADLNADGVVDSADMNHFSDLFFQQDPKADRNHDGVVDFEDFIVYSAEYLQGCNVH